MNIYLVSQDENSDYDTFDSFVCHAESEEQARNMLPSELEKWGGAHSAWCSSPDLVSVELVGLSSPGSEVGVICSSFNAG